MKLEQYKIAFKDESMRKAAAKKVGKTDTVLGLIQKKGIDETDEAVLTSITSLQKWLDSKGSEQSFAVAQSDSALPGNTQRGNP